ncbi:hypothetical protein LTR86_006098 [Recurvomyces mirabilis]|nr:hypothetical protein LTR86_006098 [Recurvomyces mirabilis]
MATQLQNDVQPGIQPYGIEQVQSPPPTYSEKHDQPQPSIERQVVNEQPSIEPNRISYVAGPKYSLPLNELGETSEWVDCPYCMKRTQTEVRKEHSSMTL